MISPPPSNPHPRIILKELTDTHHIQSYHSLLTHPTAAQWSISAQPTSLEESRTSLLAKMPTEEEPWRGIWGIFLLDGGCEEDGDGDGGNGVGANGGKFIGTIGFPVEAVVGYRLMPEYWGKGYMTEALKMFLVMWFGREGNQKYDKLSAGIDPENIGSRRVLEKAGFVKGAYVKDAVQMPTEAGRWSDIQVFEFQRGFLGEGDE
ncbi:hypothetical protein HYFRA_00001866 [Hymenoscyphus fraxineus]|uniref:N-acetyltransferase domain-containing protein n=1 Tax=Hymenoscyphus fraxineus TaxID=746836 RepID=A0A9N9KJJ2_9HELO|nr:hypothetical protein HYFRA_00001866 [Hymenoscyphus fraxineus]